MQKPATPSNKIEKDGQIRLNDLQLDIASLILKSNVWLRQRFEMPSLWG